MKWFVAILLSTTFLYISGQTLHSKPLAILSLIVLILPFALINVMMRYFTREVIIHLSPETIVFDIRKLNNENEPQMREYRLANIASYQIQFPNSKFASLILKFKSGKRHEFSFRTKKFSSAQSETTIVIEALHKFLKEHGIEFAPSFYASQKGLYAIIFLSLLSAVPLILAPILNKNVPLTIFAGFLLVGHIISRRANDLSFYKRWKQL